MPFEMSDYVQSVVVQGKVYVGGGELKYVSTQMMTATLLLNMTLNQENGPSCHHTKCFTSQ